MYHFYWQFSMYSLSPRTITCRHQTRHFWVWKLNLITVVRSEKRTIKRKRWLNIGKYLEFGPILKMICKITVHEIFTLLWKVKGQRFHTFSWGWNQVENFFQDFATFTYFVFIYMTWVHVNLITNSKNDQSLILFESFPFYVTLF